MTPILRAACLFMSRTVIGFGTVSQAPRVGSPAVHFSLNRFLT